MYFNFPAWKSLIFPVVNRFFFGEKIPVENEKLRKLAEKMEEISEISSDFDLSDPFTWPEGVSALIKTYIGKNQAESFTKLATENNWRMISVDSLDGYERQVLDRVVLNMKKYNLPHSEFNLAKKSEEAYLLPKNLILFVHSKESYLIYDTSGNAEISKKQLNLLYKYFWHNKNTIHMDLNQESEVQFSSKSIENSNYYGNLNKYRGKIERFYESNEPWSLLVQGKPGIGKTTFCYDVASSLGETVLVMSSSIFKRVTLNGWQFLQKWTKPDIVIINDIDRVKSIEGSLSLFENRNIEVDLVLLTTNYVNQMPPAFRRPGRIDHILEAEIPSREVKTSVIKNLAKEVGIEIPDDKLDSLLDLLDNSTPSHAKEILKRAKVWGWDIEEIWDIHKIVNENEDKW